jgi:hypothetical protein
MTDRSLRNLKAVTTTDRRYLQMKRGMFRMPAIVEKSLRRLLFGAYLHQAGRVIRAVDFAEVGAQAALSIMYLDHKDSDLR